MSLGLGPPEGEATGQREQPSAFRLLVPLGSQLTLAVEIPGPHLLQGLEDALPLTQLLDAQSYLMAGTFGNILLVGQKGTGSWKWEGEVLGVPQQGPKRHRKLRLQRQCQKAAPMLALMVP